MTIQQADILLDWSGFNLIPPRQDVVDALAECRYDVVDVDDDRLEYWKNQFNTLVLRFARSDVESILHAVRHLQGADDIDYHVEGEDVVVLFWWDE